MKRLCRALAIIAIGGLSFARSEARNDTSRGVSQDKVVGAWRLAWMEESGPDGKVTRITDRTGMLLYTRDGQMSVQIMFPKSEFTLTNDYVLNGYEASFGRYDVDEAKHTVTHHVQGSITRGLIGRDLTRVYQFSDGRLIIKSARPDEHWAVAWDRY